jgi:hypothetical protein
VYWFLSPNNIADYTYPVPPELGQPDWNSPKGAIAVATARGMDPGRHYVAFQNGFIGMFGIGKCDFIQKYGCQDIGNYAATGDVWDYVQLPAGKVPMGLAVTPAGEFVLAAVWDVVDHKGQIAVIAVDGRVRDSDTAPNDWNDMWETGNWLYGVPNWPTTKGIKLLGFVDLPIAAPTAIEAATDLGWTNNGRGDNNVNVDIATLLDTQTERDTWYNSVNPSVYPDYKGTAHAGYVVVASRSENKVVLVDMGPLFQYYRTMYFTTQANYDATKTTGPAADQWPYTFENTPSQTPVVKFTIDVPAPTAVAAGMDPGMCSTSNAYCNPGWNAWTDWRTSADAFGAAYAYIGTMDGRVLMYTVGGLNAEGPSTAPMLYKTVTVGKNVTSIEHGQGAAPMNDFWVSSRGDRTMFSFDAGGNAGYVLRDSRIQDPVMAEISMLWAGRYSVHVLDFSSSSVLTYGSDTEDFSGPVTFGAASPVPGHPFAYQQTGVP